MARLVAARSNRGGVVPRARERLRTCEVGRVPPGHPFKVDSWPLRVILLCWQAYDKKKKQKKTAKGGRGGKHEGES